jgi:hypothetical protein
MKRFPDSFTKDVRNGILCLSLQFTVLMFLAGNVSAAYRIPSGIPLFPSTQATVGKQVFQTCIANDTQWAYFIYLPATYDSTGTKKWPLLIFQEVAGGMYQNGGWGSASNMFDSARGGMNGGPVYDLERTPKPAYLADRFIVLSPFINGDMFGSNHGQPARLMGLYRNIIERFKIDTTRISMMGDCAGGGVVWTVAAAYPKFPAAIVAMAFNDNWCSTVDLTKACNLKNVPTRLYVDSLNSSDRVVMLPVHNAMQQCGATNESLTYTYVNTHEIWAWAGLDTMKSMYDWMLAQQTSGSTALKSSDNPKIRIPANNVRPGDRIEIVGLNGRLLFTSTGVDAKAKGLLSMAGRGVRVVRIVRAGQTAGCSIQQKW